MEKIGSKARERALKAPKPAGETSMSKKAYKPKKKVIAVFKGIKGY